MGSRTTTVAGLLAGMGAAAAILAAAVIFLPDPSPGLAGTSPTPDSSASVQPTGSALGTAAGPPTPDASIATTRFRIGQRAPSLQVAQLGGGRVDLANLAGHPVWVTFMQTTCQPCVDEFPLMNGFAARYAGTGLVVVAIDVREDEGVVAAFAQSISAQFPVGLDTDGAAATAWDAVALPTHFWIDRDGIIRAGAFGGIGSDRMVSNLQTILPGVTVTP